MNLNEKIVAQPILEEMSSEKLLDGVLCRISYPICDIGQKNANDRVYEADVWEGVHAKKDLQDKLEHRALFGHAEHPEQTQSNLEKTSHVIFEMWTKDGQEWQKFDVMDTPTGRIVDCLLRGGCRVGCSTRASGDLEEAEDDEGNSYNRVVAETYDYVTTDFTADPSTSGSVPYDVKRNIVTEVKRLFENKEADEGEKNFGVSVLESISCKDKGKCQNCGGCKVLEERKITAKQEDELPKSAIHQCAGCGVKFDDPADVNPSKLCKKCAKGVGEKKTVKSLIKDGTLKEGTPVLLQYAPDDIKQAKVKKVEENAVSLLVGVERPVAVNVDGDATISISPEGLIAILPTEILEPQEAVVEPAETEPVPEQAPEELSPCPDEGELEVGSPVEFSKPALETLLRTGKGKISQLIENIKFDGNDQIVGKITKIEETGITISLDDGTQVTIEDPTAVNITVTAPAPAEEIELVGSPPEKEDMEVDEPLPVVDPAGRFESKTNEQGTSLSVDNVKKLFKSIDAAFAKHLTGLYGTEKQVALKGKEVGLVLSAEGKKVLESKKVKEDISRKEFLSRQVKKLKKQKDDFEKENQRKLDRIEKELSALEAEGSGLKKESKTSEDRSAGDASSALTAGNLIQDKDGVEWVINDDTDAGLTITQPGSLGTEKLVPWDEVESQGFTKLSETKVEETVLPDAAELGKFVAEFMSQEKVKDMDPVEQTSRLLVTIVNAFGLTLRDVDRLMPTLKMALDMYNNLGDESKVEEATVVQKDDGWHVVSPAGIDLGGPYSRAKANQRKKDVEFYSASKESTSESKVNEEKYHVESQGGIKYEVDFNDDGTFHISVDGGRIAEGEWGGAGIMSAKILGPEELIDFIAELLHEGSYQVDESKLQEAIQVGDVVEIMDDEGNTTVMPASKVTDVDEALGSDGNMHVVVQTENGGDINYSEEHYQLIKTSITGESISTTAKEIKDLRIGEAATRAERDKAIELIAEISDEKTQLEETSRKEKAFEAKILINKIEKTLGAKERELDAVRAKLEQKAKLSADLNGQLAEQKNLVIQAQEQWEDVVVAATNRVDTMKESATAAKNDHRKNLSETRDGYQKKLNVIVKTNEIELEKAKKEITEKVRKEFVECFVGLKLSETNLAVDDNSRALLEKCKSLIEVEEVLEKIVDASRRGALHSEPITSVYVSKANVDSELQEAERQVGNALKGMNS